MPAEPQPEFKFDLDLEPHVIAKADQELAEYRAQLDYLMPIVTKLVEAARIDAQVVTNLLYAMEFYGQFRANRLGSLAIVELAKAKKRIAELTVDAL